MADAKPLWVKRLADERRPAKMGTRITAAASDETSPLMVKRLADDRKPAKLGTRITATPTEDH